MKENKPPQNPPDEGAIVNQAVDTAALALSLMRKAAGATLPKLTAQTVEDPTREDPMGEFTMQEISGIKIGPRHRRDVGDIPAFAASILEYGQLNPILLNTNLELVSGIRRLRAIELLGRKRILARIIDIDDAQLAGIEEDRARKPLTATEKYAITEMYREKMRDEAWRRRAFGGKLQEAVEKGRVDDLLARRVAISRPTLVKIKAMKEAAIAEPARYEGIVEDLDNDGKVDRHFKRYLLERMKDNPHPNFGAIVIQSGWQDMDPKILKKTISALSLSSYAVTSTAVDPAAKDSAKLEASARDETMLLLPTSVEKLAQASTIVTTAKFFWHTTLMGTDNKQERLWLLATCGKTLPQEDQISLLAEGCHGGFDKAVEAAEVATDGSCLVLDINSLVSQEDTRE